MTTPMMAAASDAPTRLDTGYVPGACEVPGTVKQVPPLVANQPTNWHEDDSSQLGMLVGVFDGKPLSRSRFEKIVVSRNEDQRQ